MNLRTGLLLGTLAFSACESSPPPPVEGESRIRYRISEPGPYTNHIYEGVRGLLEIEGVVIDTIDVEFGVHPLEPGAFLYRPLYAFHDEDTQTVMHEFGNPLVWHKGKKELAQERLPFFDPFFSLPVATDGFLYYWGVERAPTGTNRLFAVRYHIRTGVDHRVFLLEHELATDFPGLLGVPVLQEGEAIFIAPGDPPLRFILDARHWALTKSARGSNASLSPDPSA